MSWMDLHCHSSYSDGSLSVKDVIKRAAERGLTAVSLTDHDTVAGTQEALHWGRIYGITVIPGIEISAFDFTRNRRIHLLGYNYSPAPRHIEALCTPLIKARHENTVKKIEILEKAGYPISLEEVRAVAGEAPALYKQHIMQLFLQKGLTNRIYSELYEELFHKGGICGEDIRYIDVFDAIEGVIQDGGFPVLAHPGYKHVYDLIPAMVRKGLKGIELHHELNTLEDRVQIKALASTYSLVMTGGSDCHGIFGSDHKIGDIIAPESCRIPPRGKEDDRKKMARELIHSCGEMLRTSLHDEMNLKLKGGNPADLVTQYDKKVETLLIQGLKKVFPLDSFLSEEDGEVCTLASGGYTWIIDPIDGTTNFVHKQCHFSISLACYRNGEPWFGMILDVMDKKLYEGETGKGARLNGMELPRRSGSAPIGLEHSLIDLSLHTIAALEGTLDWRGLTRNIRGHRAYGCASLILCQIALGNADVYISSKLHLWDYAAGQIILSECGGAFHKGQKNHPEVQERSSILYIAASSQELLKSVGQYFQNRMIQDNPAM